MAQTEDKDGKSEKTNEKVQSRQKGWSDSNSDPNHKRIVVVEGV